MNIVPGCIGRLEVGEVADQNKFDAEYARRS